MSNNAKESRYTKWRTLIEEQEKSSLSQKDFCEQKGLVLSQFVYYRCQIKATGSAGRPLTNVFSPIQLPKNAPNNSREMRITLPNGFQCVFSYDVDAIHIKKCMEVLLSC